MRIEKARFWNVGLLSVALLVPATLAPFTLMAADQPVYHDNGRNDDHRWDSHEDRAYRKWLKENHRKHESFGRIREEDRQSYWAWRHDHPDRH